MSTRVLRQSKVLKGRIAAVRRFRDAYENVLALMDAEWDDLSGRAGKMPSPENRAEFDRRVAELGEMAAIALAAAGEVQNGVTQFGRSYNPLLQWRDPLTVQGGLATADEVMDSCNFVIGVLTHRLGEAQEVERTAAYRLGRLMTFPERARAAGGESRAAQQMAFWGSLVVGVLASLVAAGLVALGGWLVARAL